MSDGEGQSGIVGKQLASGCDVFRQTAYSVRIDGLDDHRRTVVEVLLRTHGREAVIRED